MKKTLALMLILMLSLACLAGCGDDTPPEEEGIYKMLSELVAGVDGFALSVNTAHAGGETLASNYEVEYTENGYNVNYNYEILNKIDLANPAAEYKSIRSGTAVIVDSEVKSYTGDELDVLPGKFSLDFKETYFSEVSESDGTFRANVIDVKNFLGTNKDFSDMTVDIVFSQSSFESIMLTYSTQSADVTVTYSFN